jgi:hypothetical protein
MAMVVIVRMAVVMRMAVFVVMSMVLCLLCKQRCPIPRVAKSLMNGKQNMPQFTSASGEKVNTQNITHFASENTPQHAKAGA